MQEVAILVSAHFLADLPLQGEWVAKEKYTAFKTQLGTIALFGHAAIQALVLGIAGYALGYDFQAFFWVVGSTHFLIDLGKIRGYYGAIIDQLLHFLILIALIVL